MTSDYAIMSIKSCPEVANDEYIIVRNFGGQRMSGFQVIEGGGGGGGTSEATPVARSKKSAV